MNRIFKRWIVLGLTATGLGGTGCAAVRELSDVDPINFSRGAISGTVADSITGTPIVGAAVVLLTASEDSIRNQQNKAFSFAPDGRYTFPNVLPGSYVLRAEAPGYAPKSFPMGEILAREKHTIVFRLRPQSSD